MTISSSKPGIRGFEKISIRQWNEDTLGFENGKIIICSYGDILLPKRKTMCSAGYDIFSPISFMLKPNESVKIPTGFKAYMQDDEKLVFHVRSSHGFKNFIRLANSTGIGDADYYNNINNEGHYWVKLRNEGDCDFEIKAGESIAQCIFEKYLLIDGDSFSHGNTRVGGIGST